MNRTSCTNGDAVGLRRRDTASPCTKVTLACSATTATLCLSMACRVASISMAFTARKRRAKLITLPPTQAVMSVTTASAAEGIDVPPADFWASKAAAIFSVILAALRKRERERESEKKKKNMSVFREGQKSNNGNKRLKS